MEVVGGKGFLREHGIVLSCFSISLQKLTNKTDLLQSGISSLDFCGYRCGRTRLLADILLSAWGLEQLKNGPIYKSVLLQFIALQYARFMLPRKDAFTIALEEVEPLFLDLCI